MDEIVQVRFAPGDIIVHKLYGYRGVVVDVDARFNGTDAWYEAQTQERPERSQPWYQVLVDGGQHATYVAEANLRADGSGDPIQHPMLENFFADFREDAGVYLDRYPRM